MYILKFITPPLGSIFGFTIWNFYTYYRFDYSNNNFKTIKYDIIYSFLGYTIFPIAGFYLGLNLKRFNLLPNVCLLKNTLRN